MISEKEKNAIDVFVKTFGGSYQKLDPLDIDYKLFDKSRIHTGYAEVCMRIKTMHMAYPLPVSAKKLVKLIDKRINPILIWCCEDGIIYGRADRLRGEIMWGTVSPPSDELVVYYEKQKELKYIRFV